MQQNLGEGIYDFSARIDVTVETFWAFSFVDVFLKFEDLEEKKKQ